MTGGNTPNLILKRMLSKIFSENSTTQENITISSQNLLFLLRTQKTRDSWGNAKSTFKENARTFYKNSTTQENIKIL